MKEVRPGRVLKWEEELLLIFLEKLGICLSAEKEEGQAKEEDVQELQGKVNNCFIKIINKKQRTFPLKQIGRIIHTDH